MPHLRFKPLPLIANGNRHATRDEIPKTPYTASVQMRLKRLIHLGIAKCVLSARGAIAVAAGVLLCLAAYFENDLAGAVLGPTLILIPLLLTVICWRFGRRTARNATLEVSISAQYSSSLSSRAGTETLRAKMPVTVTFEISRAAIPPSFTLILDPAFAGASSAGDAGLLGRQRIIEHPVALRRSGVHSAQGIFPHRGNWMLADAKASLTDVVGFSAYTRSLLPASAPSFRVEPTQELYPWAVISSVERAGDAVQISSERLGARLDLKTYHPADGMRSIAWKIYARRGELLARHPEAASTPEGTVVIFVVAPPDNDEVAGAAVAYARRCEELGSTVIAGALGSHSVATSAAQLLDLVIDCAFSAAAGGAAEDITRFIGAVSERMPMSILRRIAIVIPESGSHALAEALSKCAAVLNERMITGALLVVPRARHESESVFNAKDGKLPRWFYEGAAQESAPSQSPALAETAISYGFELGAER